MLNINTTPLKYFPKDKQFKIIKKTTLIFPEEKRITVSNTQITNLINIYKAKIHYVGNINDDLNNILQITGESFIGNKYGKIILGNLKKYDVYGETLSNTIKTFSEHELNYYQNLIIESSGGIFEEAISNNFELITNIEEIKYLLSIFIPDEYKYNNIKEIKKDGSYERILGIEGKVKYFKKMFKIKK